MKLTRVFAGVFTLLLLGAANTLVSLEKHSSTPPSYAYGQSSEQTVRGWVVETRDFPCPVSGTMGSHITLKNEAVTIEVHLAPAAFMKQYEINIQKATMSLWWAPESFLKARPH
jgi:hypothetical protein